MTNQPWIEYCQKLLLYLTVNIRKKMQKKEWLMYMNIK